MQKLKGLIEFITVEIWRVSLSDISKTRAFLIRKLQILVLTIRCFREDKCILRASALTFYVLMSIVPMAAMAFGIAKGFGMYEKLKQSVTEGFVEQKDVVDKVIEFSDKILNQDTNNNTLVAAVGILILFWTVTKVLSNIEISFNDMWGVKNPRTLARKFSDYLTLMVVAPISLIITAAVNASVTVFFKDLVANYYFVAMFKGIILFGLRFLPLLLISLFFTFIYILIPNTKVKFVPAFAGGVIAGILYQLLQILYIGSQASVAKYSTVYGSFAALPMFLVWLQLSWYILLFGAELAFAIQNVDTFIYEPDTSSISPALKRIFTLQIVHLIVRRFSNGEQPATDTQIAKDLDLPIRLVRDILHDLHEAKIISEVINTENNSVTFQPARAIDQLSISQVIFMLENTGSDKIPIKQVEGVDEIKKSLAEFKSMIDASPANALLKDI